LIGILQEIHESFGETACISDIYCIKKISRDFFEKKISADLGMADLVRSSSSLGGVLRRSASNNVDDKPTSSETSRDGSSKEGMRKLKISGQTH
jgi:hypothetical protein